MGLNSPLMWLRGDIGDRGMQSLGQGMAGVSPWMLPRLEPSAYGVQNDIYQAMAAAAAVQDMRTVDPSKQMLSSIMQFQHPQILQQSQASAPFFQSLPVNQAQAPSQSHGSLVHQQLLHQNSFSNNVQIHQQHQQPQHSTSMQHSIDPQQVSTVAFSPNSQAQSQTTHSMSPMHHSLSDSNLKPVVGNVNSSPLHSLLGSVTQEEAANLLNVSRSSDLLSSGGWPMKRVALDPLLSGGISQAISPQIEIDHLGTSSNTNVTRNPVSLPPFPGRECLIEQEGSSDPQNHFLFGVNIDSSSLLMQNGMSNLEGVCSEGDNATIDFASSSYMRNNSGADYSFNPTVTSSTCINDSGFMMSSDNVGHANPPSRTFVKVSCKNNNKNNMLQRIGNFYNI